MGWPVRLLKSEMVKLGFVLIPPLLEIFLLSSKNMPLVSQLKEFIKVRWEALQFSIAQAESKVCKFFYFIRDLLFADYAAVAIHTNGHFQGVTVHFPSACQDVTLVMRLKEINVHGQDVENLPSISITN